MKKIKSHKNKRRMEKLNKFRQRYQKWKKKPITWGDEVKWLKIMLIIYAVIFGIYFVISWIPDKIRERRERKRQLEYEYED